MKKGLLRIIIGCVLIILQLMSAIGNSSSGLHFSISFANISVFIYDLCVLLGYYFIGILGVILLTSGLIAFNRKEVSPHEKGEKKHYALPHFSFCSLSTKNNSVQSDSVSGTESVQTLPPQSKKAHTALKVSKRKYCSRCGSSIDSTSKKCTGCGKQYFKGIRINIPIFILVAIIIVLCILTFHTTNENKTLLQQIADKDYKNTQLSANIKDLKSEVDALYIQNGELQQQLEEAAEIHELELRRETFVLCDKETNMYHEIYRGSDCAFEYHVRVIIEVEGKYSDTYPGQYFYIRLEDAIDFGFTKCPECK